MKSYGDSWYKLKGYAGKTVTWCPSDTEERFNNNMGDAAARKKLERYGWTPESISYTFNTDGFRADEFTYNENDSVVFFGCSLTMGVGVDLESSWAYRVAQNLGLRRYNLGVAGGGPDMCFRLAYHWLPKLRPKYVIMVTPNASRFEVMVPREDIMFLPNMLEHYGNKTQFYTDWLSHPANADMNRLKAVMGVQTVCNSIGVPLLEIPVEEFIVTSKEAPITDERILKLLSLGRDLLHPGREWNEYVAEGVMKKIIESGA